MRWSSSVSTSGSPPSATASWVERSITIAAMPGELPDLKMLALFGCRAVLLRGAGYTVNDLLDRDIDNKELEEKRKEKAKISSDRRKQLAKLRIKAEKAAEEKVLRLQPGHRYCLLGQLSKEVGWNYAHTIRSVEAAAAAAAAAAVAGGTGRSPHGCRTSEVASATPFFWAAT
ncbi:uncharacterized protein [Triticum aestivum]|uniref:uncharacterized protein isoform X2 n=1 Tax=Triticum aestivum TaxID=4565 RepID=UPI001D00F583|nr:uncharacterized protein LOC123123613 isoform X2 [Triticum aestivum]